MKRIETLSKEFGKNLILENDQDYGKFYFQLYVFEKNEQLPACIVKFLVEEKEDLWEGFEKEGIHYDEWFKTREHPFLKSFSEGRICLVDTEIVSERGMFKFIEDREGVKVFVRYEDIAKINREKLLKNFLKVYLESKGYDINTDEYDMQITEDEVISFLE